MFDCSHEALQRAITSVKTKYPNSHINESLALTLLTNISRRWAGGEEFVYALRSALTECHLWDDEREWYKALAGSLFGTRGGKARHKKPQLKKHRENAKKAEVQSSLYVFKK